MKGNVCRWHQRTRVRPDRPLLREVPLHHLRAGPSATSLWPFRTALVQFSVTCASSRSTIDPLYDVKSVTSLCMMYIRAVTRSPTALSSRHCWTRLVGWSGHETTESEKKSSKQPRQAGELWIRVDGCESAKRPKPNHPKLTKIISAGWLLVWVDDDWWTWNRKRTMSDGKTARVKYDSFKLRVYLPADLTDCSRSRLH